MKHEDIEEIKRLVSKACNDWYMVAQGDPSITHRQAAKAELAVVEYLYELLEG